MSKNSTITMEHGAGGDAMQALISDIILKNITRKSAGTVGLDSMDDGATVRIDNDAHTEIVVTTDSHVIKPLFFPGGNIGRLAVSGTVNDLAMMGAAPLALTCAMIIPEGFELSVLEKIVKSMNTAAQEAGVPIITGDTKTIERGGLDSIIINTTGIGRASDIIRDCGLCAGDKIIVTGTIGDHGMALLAHREGFDFDTDLVSDVAPLWDMIKTILPIRGTGETPAIAISAMKDPTRGGLAATLNEMAQKSGMDIVLEEECIPIKKAVASACEMFGIDPLEVANEGKAIIGVKAECADEVLNLLQKHRLGKDAAIIGEVKSGKGIAEDGTSEGITGYQGKVMIKTMIGGTRYVDVPSGDLIPRVC